MKRAEKRAHLIGVAGALFNRIGFHAVGVDQVIAEAGIAKTTLYRHFKSKDDLIVAVLKRIDDQFRDDMRETVDRVASDPRQKLLATFDCLDSWFREKSFYGCPFISAAGEYADPSNPVFQQAVIHKRLMLAYFEDLARLAEVDDPKRVAEAVNLLHEGATAVAQITADPDVARKAKAVAAKLIEEARGPRSADAR